MEQRDERVAALRELIRRFFPNQRYKGRVTEYDGKWSAEATEKDAILDDEKLLSKTLTGRKWTEIPGQFLHQQPDGYELLTDEAFVAFLPAWLMQSLEDMDVESEVRDFVVYSFSSTMRKFRVLNPEQRLTVRSLLMEFAEAGTAPFVRTLAMEAVALIDRDRY